MAPRTVQLEPSSVGLSVGNDSPQRSATSKLYFSPGSTSSWKGNETTPPGSSVDLSAPALPRRPLFPTVNPQQLLNSMLGGPEPAVMPEYLRRLEEMRSTRPEADIVLYRVDRPPGSTDPTSLPLMLYLPGIDGTGLAAYRQFPSLAQRFDLCALYIPPSDRSSFLEIVSMAAGRMDGLRCAP